MPKVIYIEHNGSRHEVEVPVGSTVMRGAVDNGVPGIDADCGGEAACGTCHVIVDRAWADKVGRSGPEEEEMLSMNPERQPTSRLSCQVKVCKSWDGLTVQLPEFQM